MDGVFDRYSAGFSSGGGWASYANRSSWQDVAVASYLSGCRTIDPLSDNPHGCPTPEYYNQFGRAYPDLAIFGSDFPLSLTVDDDPARKLVRFYGTSVSAPLIAAGLVARLVSARQSIRGDDLGVGFINPILYQFSSETSNLPANLRSFNDIVKGDNVCPRQSDENNYFDDGNCHDICRSSETDSSFGYQAVEGFDPVTGLGSPNIGIIVELYTALLTSEASVIGDPVMTGFHGHSMQVHGIPGESYSLISTRDFEYNARFQFLSSGHCDSKISDRTALLVASWHISR